MSEKYCLLLGIEKSRDRALLAASRNTNLKIALMYPNGRVNNHRFADIVLAGDPNRADSVLEAVENYERATGATPAFVIPLTEMSIESGLTVAQKYDLPYMHPDTVAATRDKHTMKEKFAAAGLKVARHQTFSNLEQMQAAADQMQFPFVIKPRNAGGSEGVIFVDNQQQLSQCYEHLSFVSDLNANRYGLDAGLYQIEEFIQAEYEVSVEVINAPTGRAVCTMTDKYITGLPFFVEIGHSIPSRWYDNQDIKSAALKACEALGLDRGIAHVELKVDAQGNATLIEVNARPAGDNIMDLAEKVTGTNLFSLHIASYLNPEFVPPASLPQTGQACIAFLDAGEGLVNSVRIPPLSELPKEVVSLNIWTQEGKHSQACFDSNGRDGAVELYWPQGAPEENYHLSVARTLSQQIFNA